MVKTLPILIAITQFLWISYYVTEAITATEKGDIIVTFENYRLTTAIRYLTMSLFDSILPLILLYVSTSD
jgi:hypothetical protein